MFVKHVRRWPWVAQQEWKDVLFIHFPVSYDHLKPYIPTPFELETYDGQAWISVILFQAKNSRLRGMPIIMSYPPFLQMNVRTYITFDGEPGIYFLSVDVNRMLPFAVAKHSLQLPYAEAAMEMKQYKNYVLFESKRTKPAYPFVSVSANYRTLAQSIVNQQGTLSYWLTERYCFWMIKGNKIIKSPLSHLPWELHEVALDFNMTNLTPFEFSQVNPLVHYAKSIHAYLHPFEVSGIYGDSL